MWPFSKKKKKKTVEEESKKDTVKKEKIPESSKKEEQKKDVTPKKEKTESVNSSEDKKRTETYHVSKRQKDGKWQVKFGGSDKPIKLFDTQAEALSYAKELSQKYDKSLTIHKKDGKIRKQKY